MLSDRLIPIKSTCFNASGYFGSRAVFRYRNGRVIYRRIPVTLWQAFMEAGSKGSFFREKIKSFALGRERKGCHTPNTPGHFSKSRDDEGVTAPPLCNQVPVTDCSTPNGEPVRKSRNEVQPA